MPAASGRYSLEPASGLSQMRRWQLRRRRAVSVAHDRRVAAVPAVADDDHDAARAQHPPRPALVELPERAADARAARPVAHGRAHPVQRTVGVAVAQLRA